MTHQEIQTNNQPNTTEGKVGYKRPPVKSRFRKGQSGNPHGRLKGQRNMGPVLAEVLRQTVTVKQEGKSQRMSKGEALIQMLLSKALNGDSRTIKAMLDLAQKIARIDTPELKLAGHGNYEFMLVPGMATSAEEWEWEISNRDAMATIRETVAAALVAGISLTTSQRAFLRETVDAARAARTLLTTIQIEAIRECLGVTRAAKPSRTPLRRPLNRIDLKPNPALEQSKSEAVALPQCAPASLFLARPPRSPTGIYRQVNRRPPESPKTVPDATTPLSTSRPE
jgi:hypothetical protein